MDGGVGESLPVGRRPVRPSHLRMVRLELLQGRGCAADVLSNVLRWPVEEEVCMAVMAVMAVMGMWDMVWVEGWA